MARVNAPFTATRISFLFLFLYKIKILSKINISVYVCEILIRKIKSNPYPSHPTQILYLKSDHHAKIKSVGWLAIGSLILRFFFF